MDLCAFTHSLATTRARFDNVNCWGIKKEWIGVLGQQQSLAIPMLYNPVFIDTLGVKIQTEPCKQSLQLDFNR